MIMLFPLLLQAALFNKWNARHAGLVPDHVSAVALYISLTDEAAVAGGFIHLLMAPS
jgi:hypothetical protein